MRRQPRASPWRHEKHAVVCRFLRAPRPGFSSIASAARYAASATRGLLAPAHLAIPGPHLVRCAFWICRVLCLQAASHIAASSLVRPSIDSDQVRSVARFRTYWGATARSWSQWSVTRHRTHHLISINDVNPTCTMLFICMSSVSRGRVPQSTDDRVRIATTRASFLPSGIAAELKDVCVGTTNGRTGHSR